MPPRERARYQGYFIAVFGTSSVAGPVVGGLFAAQPTLLGITGWRWVFLINVPIGLVALVMSGLTVRLPQVRIKQRVDYAGAAALALTLVPLLVYAEFGREWGWLSGRSRLMIAIGVLGLVAFVLVERRMGDDAILPARLFRNNTMPVAAAMNLVVGAGMFGGLAALPLYLQIVRGKSPVEAGLLLLPMSAGIALGAMISGQLIARTGRYRSSPVIGAAFLVAGMIALSQVSVEMPISSVCLRAGLFGLGLGLTMQPLLVAAQNAVPTSDLGTATSTVSLFRQIGGTVGTSVCLSLLFDVATSRIEVSLKRAVSDDTFARSMIETLQSKDPADRQILTTVVQQLADGHSTVVERLTQNSSLVDLLDPVLADPILIGFTQAMSLVFAVSACVLVLAQVLVVALPDRRLARDAPASAALPRKVVVAAERRRRSARRAALPARHASGRPARRRRRPGLPARSARSARSAQCGSVRRPEVPVPRRGRRPGA